MNGNQETFEDENVNEHNHTSSNDSHQKNEESFSRSFEKLNMGESVKNEKKEDKEEKNNDDYYSCSEEENDDGNGNYEESEKDNKESEMINEETLKLAESKLTEEEKHERMQRAVEKKERGNAEYTAGNCEEAVQIYSDALEECLICEHDLRSVLLSNRAAALIKLDKKQDALEDLDKSLRIKPSYMRARLRRADLNEQMDRLDESLEDYKAALEADPSLHVARAACMRLPEKIRVKTEKMKEEVFGKLKDLGNVILKPFGLSTDNFKVQQDPNTGSYSINMQK